MLNNKLHKEIFHNLYWVNAPKLAVRKFCDKTHLGDLKVYRNVTDFRELSKCKLDWDGSQESWMKRFCNNMMNIRVVIAQSA
jgi:hypothetical protein